MIIDNKTTKNPGKVNEVTSVWDFIKYYANYQENVAGNFDIVTGFFSIAGLSVLYKELSPNIKYNIVLAEMMSDDDFLDRVIDLLQENSSIENALRLSEYAQNALNFLKRESVEVRAVSNSFCHAKAYMFENELDPAHNFFVTGSSNLTEAGLGIKATSNVELNIAETGDTNNTHVELKNWFKTQWDTIAKLKIRLNPNEKTETEVKQYFIDRIETIFKAYTPEEIYYKILFELFNPDLEVEDIEDRNIRHLEDSVIYKTLFEYQKKGVISLIKKLNKFGGAILADAVGLGKTFSALAVMKYYQDQGYEVVLLCPKKLENNWTQYLRRKDSRFEKDEFDYIVRFHTDLDGKDNPRLERAYADAPLHWLQDRSKLLLVIDESHNLRNEKSNRYINLLEKLVKNCKDVPNRDFKVLQLSATPINNSFDDIKSQFNLIAQGDDTAFRREEFELPSLINIFTTISKKFNKWAVDPERTIKQFVETIPSKFFKLTDNLIVARTRHLIEKTLGEDLGFPKKNKPKNIYLTLDCLGKYQNSEDIYKALVEVKLAAYMPSRYMKIKQEGNLEWNDDQFRELFLVKMMLSLFFKRLESCWKSLLITLCGVLDAHVNTYNKVIAFQNSQSDEEFIDADVELDEDGDFYVGKKQLSLSNMENIEGFKIDLENDIKILTDFITQIKDFEKQFVEGRLEDPKLERLMSEIDKKQNLSNKKIVIFTAYADTAQYLYNNINAQRPNCKVAMVTGSGHQLYDNMPVKNINEILQRFAPYSKIFKELEWKSLYEDAGLSREKYFDDRKKSWNVDFETWKKLLNESDTVQNRRFATLLNNEIDVLIATDCLSEGQNLQDADLVINYDIHWNPVRIIQRLGRIDRIGSPNKVINSINFWPSKSIDKYLKLENRIINRMSAMTITGAETVDVNQQFENIIKDNPIVSDSEKKLLEQMANNNISDIEGEATQTLQLSDFSLELYRQDLTDYFKEHKDKFKNMPTGAFSGFTLCDGEDNEIPESLVAVVAYPHKVRSTDKYQKIYLMLQPFDTSKTPEFIEMNYGQILSMLHRYRKKDTYLPDWIMKADNEKILGLSNLLKEWLKSEAPKQTKNNIMAILKGGKISAKKNKTMEEEFDISKYDLLAWEYITR